MPKPNTYGLKNVFKTNWLFYVTVNLIKKGQTNKNVIGHKPKPVKTDNEEQRLFKSHLFSFIVSRDIPMRF